MTKFENLEYYEVEHAVMETARGRWFLAEFAKRNRSSETTLLLSAIDKLERALSRNTDLDCQTKNQSSITDILYDLELLLTEIFPENENGNFSDLIRNTSNSISIDALNLAIEADIILDMFSQISPPKKQQDLFFRFDKQVNNVMNAAVIIKQHSKKISALAEIYIHFHSRLRMLIDPPNNSKLDSIKS